MNRRAEKVFIALPNAIDQIDMGIIYAHDGSDVPDPTFTMFRIDLTYLIGHYIKKGFFTNNNYQSLMDQLDSKDKGDWLIAFMSIDAQKHKLWQDTDQNM